MEGNAKAVNDGGSTRSPAMDAPHIDDDEENRAASGSANRRSVDDNESVHVDIVRAFYSHIGILCVIDHCVS